MPKSKKQTPQLKTFLNSRHSIQLPSNLLKKNHQNLSKTISPQKMNSLRSRYQTTTKHFKQRQTMKLQNRPIILQQQPKIPSNNVLYKRLSNIRQKNNKVSNLSFSKMLSKMIVMDQDQDLTSSHLPYQLRMRHTTYTRPVSKKTIQLQTLQMGRKTQRSFSRNSQISQKREYLRKKRQSQTQMSNYEKQDVSKKLFRKYYLPNSQKAQITFLQTNDPNDKYVYQDGKRIQCKRIHNFYTSNMFKTGYDKCFGKNSEINKK